MQDSNVLGVALLPLPRRYCSNCQKHFIDFISSNKSLTDWLVPSPSWHIPWTGAVKGLSGNMVPRNAQNQEAGFFYYALQWHHGILGW